MSWGVTSVTLVLMGVTPSNWTCKKCQLTFRMLSICNSPFTLTFEVFQIKPWPHDHMMLWCLNHPKLPKPQPMAGWAARKSYYSDSGQESIVFQQLLIQIKWHLQRSIGIGGFWLRFCDVRCFLDTFKGGRFPNDNSFLAFKPICTSFGLKHIGWVSSTLIVLSGNMSLSKRIKKNILQLYRFTIAACTSHEKMPVMWICWRSCVETTMMWLGCWTFVEVVTDSEQQLWMTIFSVPWKLQHGALNWLHLMPTKMRLDEHSCAMLHLFGAGKHPTSAESNIADSESFLVLGQHPSKWTKYSDSCWFYLITYLPVCYLCTYPFYLSFLLATRFSRGPQTHLPQSNVTKVANIVPAVGVPVATGHHLTVCCSCRIIVNIQRFQKQPKAANWSGRKYLI